MQLLVFDTEDDNTSSLFRPRRCRFIFPRLTKKRQMHLFVFDPEDADATSRLYSEVFYGQEPPSGESTTTECGFNYQLIAVIY